MPRTRRLCSFATSALVAMFALTMTSAEGHGGAYRGPPGPPPPGARPPSDPPPPPGEVSSHPEPPAAPGLTAKDEFSSYDDWTYWWNCNKDEFADRRSALLMDRRASYEREKNSAVGRRPLPENPDHWHGPLDSAVRCSAMPALHTLVDRTDVNFDIQAAGLIALAKIGDLQLVERAKRRLTKPVGKSAPGEHHVVVQETSALALGLVGLRPDEERAFLIDLAGPRGPARGHSRPFAAIALGLTARRSASDANRRTAFLDLLAAPQTDESIKPAALVGLGLTGDAAAVPELLFMLRHGRVERRGAHALNARERAFVVEALGRIGLPSAPVEEESDRSFEVVAAIEGLLKHSGETKEPREVRISAAIALGKLAPACSPEWQGRLLNTLRRVSLHANANELSVRVLATIAIGRMGSSDGISNEFRKQAVAALTRLMQTPKVNPNVRAHAGLGVGLIAHAQLETGATVSEEHLLAPLRRAFGTEPDPRTRAAFAVSLGLARDSASMETLAGVLASPKSPPVVRRYSAVGIGLSGSKKGLPAILEQLNNHRDRTSRIECLFAVGLIGDATCIAPVMKVFLEPDPSIYVQGAVVKALGQIGTVECFEEMVKIASDPEDRIPDQTRAMAVAALGEMSDPRSVAPLTRVTRDLNVRACPNALRELLSVL